MVDNIVAKTLLSPFSLLYGAVISARNLLYDSGVVRASKFSLPIISIGNLSIGGAGKTPHIEYLIHLLNPYLEVATLSRGYNRQTKGYRLVQPNDTALDVGDEPLMYAKKYNEVMVAVGESRSLAIPQMVLRKPALQAILLDDAFQHRSVEPYINILLTPYDQPFTKDFMLPSGRLREWASSYKRADIIIVTKCSPDLTVAQKQAMIDDIAPTNDQNIFFSMYEYGDTYSLYQNTYRMRLNEALDAIVISAIANTDYMMKYVEPKVASYTLMQYEDHHNFTEYDIDYIIKVFNERDTKQKFILTTEKDAMRLIIHRDKLQKAQIPVFILPLRVKFLFDEQPLFDELIRTKLLAFES